MAAESQKDERVKISNETKVGAIAVVSIALLVLGFNFLKGKRAFTRSTRIYAIYSNVEGVTASNPVMVNGLQVGRVYELNPEPDMKHIVISLNITSDINIPSNSVAIIRQNPITNTSIEIKLGDAKTMLENNDTISTLPNEGILVDILSKVDPVIFEVRKTVTSLDTLTRNINDLFTRQAKDHIAGTLAHLNELTASLTVSAASLQSLLNEQTGGVAKTVQHLNSVTGNLAANNGRITNMITNLDSTAARMARLDLEQTLGMLDNTIRELHTTISMLNKDTGTIGKLLYDPTLYRNLASTSNKLNVLMDDIRLHPKRYLTFSMIGGRQKGTPLMAPLPDSFNAPYKK